MYQQNSEAEVRATVEKYFAGDERLIHLDAGQILLTEGELNDRLYCLRTGRLAGHVQSAGGLRTTTLQAGPGAVVGVQSFFSGSHRSAQTVVAVEPSTLVWIDRQRWPEDDRSIERAMMPVIVSELIRRQQMVAELAEQHREEQQEIERLERFSFLGQLAAGVAHELNNALTVLVRGTQWVGRAVSQRVAKDQTMLRDTYELGMSRGRSVSSAEARQRINHLKTRFNLSYAQARKLAQTGISDQQLATINDLNRNLDTVLELWELGATLNDMQFAAEQAEHVVTSMKNLGARSTSVREPVDVNDSIRVAIRIMHNATKGIKVVEQFGAVEPVNGNRGELVQIWSNLIKNSAEAINSAGGRGAPGRITITSAMDCENVVVTVEDTGSGIPADLLPRIFEPSVTTKKTGLSFGLGLGLSIVQRHATDYGGQVTVSNTGRGARFVVTFPTGAPS